MDLKTAKDRYGMGNGHTYRLILPEIVGAGSQRYFDLFVASTTTAKVLVKGIYPIVKGDVAVTGTLAQRLDVWRTSAIGTAGTAATADATTVVPTIVRPDPNSPALPSGITARSLPTGGATVSSYLDYGYAFVEETNAATYEREGKNLIKGGTILVIDPGEGLLVQQGSVASVNSIGFVVDFEVV